MPASDAEPSRRDRPGPAAFSAVPMERMREVDRRVTQNPGRGISGAGYSSVIGGPGVERDPLDAGAGDRIPMLAG